MKEKIAGILICMLLVSVFLSASGAIKPDTNPELQEPLDGSFSNQDDENYDENYEYDDYLLLADALEKDPQQVAKAVEEINQINDAIDDSDADWEAGITSVSLIPDEQKQFLHGVQKEKNEQIDDEEGRVAGAYKATLPDEFDWRDVNGVDWTTPIRTQGSCSSCVAFGAIGALESVVQIAAGEPWGCDLSEASLFFCGGGSCSRGWYPSNAFIYLQDYGVPYENCLPYLPYNLDCSDRCSNWQDTAIKIKRNRGVYNNVEDVQSALIEHGPLTATFRVYNDFYYYKSGIYKYSWGNYMDDHFVTIIGYNDVQDYWICKNSWGTNWGEKGYFKVAYGQCGITSDVHYLEIENDIPSIPEKPTGLTYGEPYIMYEYSTRATDPDENKLFYLFDWDDGSESEWIGLETSGETISASHSWNSMGVYNVRVKTRDIYGAESDWSEPLKMHISAIEPIPIDFYCAPGHPTNPLEVISFYDNTAYPEQVEPESWLWNFGDGYLSILQNPIHCYYVEGTYTVTFTIYDNYGGETSLEKTLVVSSSSANIPPEAGFSYSPLYPIISEEIQFTDQSVDPDGMILSWQWNFDDGITSTDQNPVYVFTNSGTYSVTLTVTDNDDTMTGIQQDVIVYVERPNIPPTAGFSYQPINPTDLEIVQFSDQSSDSDGEVVSWEWDFGDGGTSTEQNPTHNFADDGTYIVSLRVWDNDNAQSEIYQDSITVLNVAPNADFNYALSEGYSGNGSSNSETITVYSTSADGCVYIRDVMYPQTWEAEEGEYISYSSAGCNIGQMKIRSDYQIYRAFFYFDTSTIPLNAVVTEATLTLYGKTYASSVDFALVIQHGTGSYPHNPMIYSDYNKNHYIGNGGSLSINDFISYAFNDIELNAEGRSWINKGSITIFCLRTDRDINGNQPTGAERTYIDTAESGFSKTPKLTITYTYTTDPIGIDFTDTSTDPDGTIIAWSWDFGDGNTSSEQNPTHGYESYGSYQATLTVTDDDGLTDTIQKLVSITPE